MGVLSGESIKQTRKGGEKRAVENGIRKMERKAR